MALPKSVEEQGKLAEELQKQIAGAADEPVVEQPKEEEPKEPEQQAELEVTEPEEKKQETPEPEGEPVKVEEGEPQIEVDEGEQKPKQKKVEGWEQKYKTLQGIHKSLTKDAKTNATKIAELQAQTEGLQRLLATLNRQPQGQQQPVNQTPQGQGTVVPSTPLKPLSIEDYKDFDPEVHKLVETVNALIGEREGLQSHIAQLNSGVYGVAAKQVTSQKAAMTATLSREVPNWQQIDSDPGWATWLNGAENLYGRQIARADILKDATARMNNGDVNAVPQIVALMKAYQGATGLHQESVLQDQETPIKPIPLANQVTPENRPGQPQTGPKQKKKWKASEIQTFYNDRIRNKYTPEQADKIEQDINEALLENRIVVGI